MTSDNIEKLRVLLHKFNEVETDMKFFFENLPVLFFIADKGGKLTMLNKEWTNYLGWTTNELMSQPWLSFVHPDDQQKTIEVAELMEGEVLEGFVNRYRCKDGSYKPVKWFASTWIDGKNYGVALKED